jgi:hypothetical protein
VDKGATHNPTKGDYIDLGVAFTAISSPQVSVWCEPLEQNSR